MELARAATSMDVLPVTLNRCPVFAGWSVAANNVAPDPSCRTMIQQGWLMFKTTV
jgi:hypothetical protein